MQKVGAVVDSIQTAHQVFETVGEIVRTSDLVAAGLRNWEISKLCSDGQIVRIRNGYYRLPENENVSEETLIAQMLPQAIVCVESALFYYGYSDFAPRCWSVAIPRTASRTVKQMEAVPVKAYYISKEYWKLGKTTAVFAGVELAIYDRERTICDCFRYRTKLDSELFNKAIHAYVADSKRNLRNLALYAKTMKIYDKVMNVMEVVLNG